MASRSETILQALHARLLSLRAKVERNSGIPEDVDACGLVVMHDGDPGQPVVTLSPLTYHYEHRAELDVFVSARCPDDDFDAIKVAIGQIVAANRTLGGLCDWIEAEAARPIDIPLAGAMPVKAVTFPVVLHYSAADTLT